MCNSYSFSQYVCGRMCAHLLCAFSVDTSIIKLRVTHMTSARATGRRTPHETRYRTRYGRYGTVRDAHDRRLTRRVTAEPGCGEAEAGATRDTVINIVSLSVMNRTTGEARHTTATRHRAGRSVPYSGARSSFNAQRKRVPFEVAIRDKT